MATFQRREGRSGRASWRVRVRIAGQTRTETFRRKTDAELWAAKTEGALRDGLHYPGREERRRTLSDVIARYRDKVLPRYGPREQRQRGRKLTWWERQLGTRRVVELSAAEIGDALDRLTCGPATSNRYLTVLKHVLSVARREWEWVTDNPAARVRARKEPRGRLRYLSEEERHRLLAACRASDEPRLHPLVVVALGTGARQGELLGLRWSDVDLVRCRATLEQTKNGERRVLPLEGPVLAAIRERRAASGPGTHQVFGSERGLATFPRNAWEQALREAEVPDFHFHDIRHTFASYLAMSGATLAELAEALGHKTLAMVKRYAHLSEAHTSGVVRRMLEKFLI
jgi:integrase